MTEEERGHGGPDEAHHGAADRPFGEHPEAAEATGVVLDTNIFVAAGFSPGSASGRIVRAVRDGRLMLVWNAATRRETERILKKIPPIRDQELIPLFEEGYEYTGETDCDAFAAIEDPDDRKFAALAAAADVELVSQDDHLLAVANCWPGRLRITSPRSFVRRHMRA